MLLQRFYNDLLAQASYLVGCPATGEALVVDPTRDVDQYVAAAAAAQLRITHVTETHIHADFVSGARELAAATGAALLLSNEGGVDWRYAFAAADHAQLLRDGDQFMVGRVRIDVLHTPGHTPEHVAFLVTDTAAADEPMGMLTGDFIFVGDVGRPDLLERAAHIAGTMDAAARQLFASIARTRQLPDWLQLWPGHGAGSACGKALGAVPSTTLGYERRFNWAFQVADEASFVKEVLAGQPEPPPYFAVMKQIDRDGPAPSPRSLPPWIDARAAGQLLRGGAFVMDTRPTAQFAAGHMPGSIAVPFGASFLTYAGAVAPHDRDLVVIAAREEAARAIRALRLIGLDRTVATADTNVIAAYEASGNALARIPLVTPDTLARRGGTLLDVRGAGEWTVAHHPDATRIVLGELSARVRDIDRDVPVTVVCQSGSRSVIGASILRAAGFDDVCSVAGGIDAWQRWRGQT
jgi:hydroxyacylglutathione hydrolase